MAAFQHFIRQLGCAVHMTNGWPFSLPKNEQTSNTNKWVSWSFFFQRRRTLHHTRQRELDSNVELRTLNTFLDRKFGLYGQCRIKVGCLSLGIKCCDISTYLSYLSFVFFECSTASFLALSHPNTGYIPTHVFSPVFFPVSMVIWCVWVFIASCPSMARCCTVVSAKLLRPCLRSGVQHMEPVF